MLDVQRMDTPSSRAASIAAQPRCCFAQHCPQTLFDGRADTDVPRTHARTRLGDIYEGNVTRNRPLSAPREKVKLHCSICRLPSPLNDGRCSERKRLGSRVAELFFVHTGPFIRQVTNCALRDEAGGRFPPLKNAVPHWAVFS